MPRTDTSEDVLCDFSVAGFLPLRSSCSSKPSYAHATTFEVLLVRAILQPILKGSVLTLEDEDVNHTVGQVSGTDMTRQYHSEQSSQLRILFGCGIAAEVQMSWGEQLR